MSKKDFIDYHLQRQQRLSSHRAEWETRWQDVVDYLMPWKEGVTSQNVPGASKTSKIYSGIPMYAQNILTAGLMGHLTSQQAPWFRMVTRNLDLMDIMDVRDWLDDSTRVMILTLDSSNFYQAIEEFYQDLSGFGTAHMLQLEDPVDVIRYYPFPVREVTMAESSRGVIDTHYREYSDTLRQLAEDFGKENLSKESQDAIDHDQLDKEIKILHAVFPRESFNPNLMGGANMPFASIYIEMETKHVLSDSGFHENAWHTARWFKGSREVYGRGPGINAMPDIKTLHAQEKTNLRAGQKIIEPPLWVPATLEGRLNITPKAVNYYKPGKNQEKPEPLFLVKELPYSLEMTDRTEERVKYAFFVDVFLMLSGQTGQMTATEVVERVQERLMILGPALGRLHGEAFSPMLERLFSVLARGGHLPAPPEALRDEIITIEYISPLAKALRTMEGGAVSSAFGMAEPFLMLDPQAADVINSDEGVRRSFELYGAPTDLLRSEEEVSLIRQERAKMAQAQAIMAAMQQGADTDKTMAEAESARS